MRDWWLWNPPAEFPEEEEVVKETFGEDFPYKSGDRQTPASEIPQGPWKK